MLKRADLLKKLELTIQQEIKNYNDSLSSILLRLNHMNDSIHKIEQDALANDAAIISSLKSLEISSDCRNDARLEDFKRMCLNFTHLEHKIEKLEIDVTDVYSDSLLTNQTVDVNDQKLNQVCFQVDKIEQEMINFTNHMHDKIENILFRLNKEIYRAKQEILSIPSEAKSVKEVLEQRINTHAIDVEGLLKEIRNNNKYVLILEKKIEHLYTLVGRLQKEGSH